MRPAKRARRGPSVRTLLSAKLADDFDAIGKRVQELRAEKAGTRHQEGFCTAGCGATLWEYHSSTCTRYGLVMSHEVWP